MQGVQRAATLTARLLSFARQAPLEPEPVDVGRLLDGLSDLLRRTLGEGAAITVLDPAEALYVWADPTELENALLSLAVNLRDLIPDGGAVTLSVDSARAGGAWMSGDPPVLPGDYVRIAFSASCAGGDGEPAGWRHANGSADLSMARSFVREAGGYLLRSDRSRGAAGLCLLLPRYQPSPPAAVRPRQAGAPVTVLVVEDDAAVRQACVEALSALRCRVLQAPDAMEAFRLIADHGGIDLLLTDLGLPGGVSGKALADAARNVDRGIRVVFTTGYDRADPRGIPGSVTISKPFSPAQLVECVRGLLGETGSADGQGERLTA
jgi:CheY-like chemotaxis protein